MPDFLIRDVPDDVVAAIDAKATVTRLEVGFSAHSAEELRVSTSRPALASMPIEYLTPTTWRRASAVGRRDRRGR